LQLLYARISGGRRSRADIGESTISTFLPIKLSVIRLPQSMRAPLMTMRFSILGADDFDAIANAYVSSDVGVWAHLAAVSENCVSNLLREGITGEEVRLVGDTMYESIIRHVKDIEVEKAARGYWLIWVSRA